MFSTSSPSETTALIAKLKKELDDKYAPEMQFIAEQIRIKEETILQLQQEVEKQKEYIVVLEAKYAEDKKKTVELYESEIQRLTKEIVNLKQELEKTKFIRSKSTTVNPRSDVLTLEDLQTLLIEDPRIRNRPLPFDAQITYMFGGLAYTSTTYLGYVWRQGRWYQMTSDLVFPKLSRGEYLEKIKAGENLIVNYDNNIVMDDLFVPIIKHNSRYFIRISVSNKIRYPTYPHAPKYELTSIYLYCTDNNTIKNIAISNNTFPNAFNPKSLTFEDPNYVFDDIDIMFPNVLPVKN